MSAEATTGIRWKADAAPQTPEQQVARLAVENIKLGDQLEAAYGLLREIGSAFERRAGWSRSETAARILDFVADPDKGGPWGDNVFMVLLPDGAAALLEDAAAIGEMGETPQEVARVLLIQALSRLRAEGAVKRRGAGQCP